MKDFEKGSYGKRSSRGSDRGGSRRSDRGSFNRRDRSESFGRSPGGFSRGRGRREERMPHKVVCDGCGKDCEVPFKPTAGKPVYCNDCFKDKGKGKGSSGKGCNCNCEQDIKKLEQKLDMVLEIVKGLKTMGDSAKVEEKAEKKVAKPKVKKATKKKAVKKKTAKKTTKKK